MKILGVNNYQAQKDSRVNFGMKPLQTSQMTEIAAHLSSSMPSADKIVAHMENEGDAREILNAVSGHLERQLFRTGEKARYAGKVLENISILAYSFKQGVAKKFGLAVESNVEKDFIGYVLDSFKILFNGQS